MKETTRNILNELGLRYPVLQGILSDVEGAFTVLKNAYDEGKTLYVCGNGGSCSDSEHIVGELMKCFKKKRPLPVEMQEKLASFGEKGERLAATLENGLRAVSLCGHSGLSTAYANDRDPMLVFAQQVGVWGREGDVLMTLSTSGNSQNCVYAALVAKAKNIKTIALVGGMGGELKTLCDVSIVAPEKETYKVQELHLPIYHCLCAMLEEEFF